MLKPGSKVQDFSAPAFINGKKDKLQWSDLKGSWVVLFFWPFDFTGICGSEVKAFHEQEAEFSQRGVKLVGVSCDSVHSHEAWVKRDFGGELKYPLVGDFTKAVATQFGVLNDALGCAYRGAFLIDTEGTVKAVVANDLPIGRSTDEILRLVDAFQSGGACPVNWHKKA